MKSNTTFVDGSGSGQIPCPFCRQPIAISVERVLVGKALGCDACGAELEVDRNASAEALADLERSYSEYGRKAGAEDEVPAAGPSAVSAPRRGRPRPPRRRR